ncbi:MAG: diaminopimelate decarboxylase [Gammaproteobacteria bacterium]|nr:diaminopimelate decarboxylase [Gammaproteobacteria bacterium]
MSFNHVDGRLLIEAVPASAIADRFGTPCYVYSRARLEANWRTYDRAFGARRHRIHYAVKANGNLALLNLLHRLGSGFDIVSGGELARAIAAGASGAELVFSGVGKSQAELTQALAAGVGCINVESVPELERLNAIAQNRGQIAPIALRVNPDVDPKTHPYISTGLEQNKFGIPIREALALYQRAARLSNIAVRGVACHIGSQLTTLAPIADAVSRVVDLALELERHGIALSHIDVGGGLGIVYQDETPPSVAEYVRTLSDIPERFDIHLEPGRSIVGDVGVLLTSVEYVKQTPAKHFAICDAAMTELIRPALYQAWHDVVLIEPALPSALAATYDLVGPVCETADFLAYGRALALSPGTRLALMNAGAYGFSMASNYNARPRPPEILVDGANVIEIRRRETLVELMTGEAMAP